MTFRDDLREICFNARAIPGALGMRPYTVVMVTETWSGGVETWGGGERGQGTPTRTETTILEADGQNPKVRQLNTEELALGGYAKGTWKIGPITPDFPGGGTPRENLLPDPADNTLVFYVLTGPAYPTGQRFTIVDVTDHRAFQYLVTVTEAPQNVRG
jgi:hypothetical protein